MKKYQFFSLLITAILVILLSSTVFLQEFSSLVPQDTTLTIQATGKQSKNSWGQSVRIRSILIDEKKVDLESFLPSCDGFSLENGLLTAHQTPATLDITLNDVTRIDIDLIGEDGSGFAEIQIGDQKKEIDLYRQGGWHSVKLSHINHGGFAPHQHPQKVFILFFIIYSVVSFVFRFFFEKQSITLFSAICLISGLVTLGYQIYPHAFIYVDLCKPIFICLNNLNIIVPVFTLLAASFFPRFSQITLWLLYILAATESLSLIGSLFNLKPYYFFLNILVLLSILGVALLFVRNLFLSACIVSFLMLFGVLANYYTIQFRGSPISFTDIFSIKTALDVTKNYSFTLNSTIVFAVFLFVFGIIILYPLKNKRLHLPTRCACALLSGLFLFSLNIPSTRKILKVSLDPWDINNQCVIEGFWLSFFDRISYSFITAPDGFSNDRILELEEKYSVSTPDKESFNTPNIIVVMNESFADIEAYEGFSSSEPLMPYLYSLKNRPNTHSGFVQVPVFGGGTCVSEFEFLSGLNSLHYFSKTPYDILNENISALPSVIKTLGYTSIALHPCRSTNWNRNIGFPKIGFDHSIFEDTGMYHQDLVREFISDKSFYDEIIMIDQQTQAPLFLFGISMQNHGGYTFESFEEPIQIVSPAGDYPLATQYINLVRESDRAFEEFISYYEKQIEPTIVLFFGDHLPKIENSLLDSLQASYLPQASQERLQRYHTPYYIWANFDLDKSQLPPENALISLSFLQTVLSKAAGLPMTGYQQLLYQLLQQYPVISSFCILDKDGNLVETESSEIPIIRDYNHLQYALLKNKSDLFTFH